MTLLVDVSAMGRVHRLAIDEHAESRYASSTASGRFSASRYEFETGITAAFPLPTPLFREALRTADASQSGSRSKT
jgi:hypothetical protein